ncbi:unnamed protein product [Urochloa decumbens]|uniref:F-box domain-containing protein n=1 Tax=Urochloa decumbens TaxID=240449 RepID=A0ABC8X9J6_9POAL
MELPTPPPPPPPANGSSRKRKSSSAGGLGDLHDDMLERVLARLPPSSYSRLRAVCRRWRAAAASPTFLHACARVPSRDPWFLMLSAASGPAVSFDAAESAWTRTRSAAAAAAPGNSVPVAASGGLVLYRAPATGALSVTNPLTGASRALPSPPPPPNHHQLLAVAMYGAAPYRVAIFTGDLPDLSMAVFDSSTNSWSAPMPLARRMPNDASCPAAAAGDDDDDGTVYFLSKSGDVVSTNMQRSASKQYSSAVVPSPAGAAAVAYFLSNSGTVVACDTARREYSELPRILPVYSEYSVDVVACGGAAYAVVLAEYLDTASLRVWEFAGAGAGEWRQVAAMPPAMSHGFRGRRADINCVGHGDRLMVCVSSGDGGGCFMCDVVTNRWEELAEHVDGDGEVSEFLAAFSFEPRVEITV